MSFLNAEKEKKKKRKASGFIVMVKVYNRLSVG